MINGAWNPLRNLREWITAHPDDVVGACRQTRELSIWEGSLWSVMWGLGESYIIPFALFLGAGNWAMGFLGTAPLLITALAQLFGAVLLDRVRLRKPMVVAGSLIQAVVFIPLFFLPLSFPSLKIPLLLSCVVAYFFFFGMAAAPWMSLMGDVVDSNYRGRFFSRRAHINTLFLITARLLAGGVLTEWTRLEQTVIGFGFLFLIASGARLASIPLLQAHYDAPLSAPTAGPHFTFGAFLRGSGHPNFTRFAVSIAIMSGCSNIAGPFIAVYMLRDLQWTYLAFTANVTVFMLAQALFVRWWGTMADCHGNRAVLLACSCLLPICPLCWVISDNYLFLLWAQVLSGAAWAGFNLAVTNFIYDSVAQADRARAVSYQSILSGGTSILGGLLIGAGIAQHAPSTLSCGSIQIAFISSLPVVFLVSALLRALVAGFLIPRFKEIRPVESVSTVYLLGRFLSGQPLWVQSAPLRGVLKKWMRNR